MSTALQLPAKRSFNFNGLDLPDPDPSMPPEKVGEFYALLHSELNNSNVKGPVVTKDGIQQFKFEVKIGPYG